MKYLRTFAALEILDLYSDINYRTFANADSELVVITLNLGSNFFTCVSVERNERIGASD